MGREALRAYLKSRQAAVTPVTPEKIMGLQENPLRINAVTPVTPVTSINTDSREVFQPQPQPSALKPASSEPPALAQPPAPAPDKQAKPVKLKYLEWADGWIELDKAYQRHHWSCPQCQAAGRRANGLRCGVGASLYRAYEDASADRSMLDW